MKNSRYELFEKELKKTTRQLYFELIEKVSKDDICGFSLYTDDSAMSISAAVNTYKHWDENIKEEPGYDSYFRFSPNEWEFDSINSKELDYLSGVLQKGLFSTPKNEFIEHRNRIYNIIVDVLEELKKEALFVEFKDDFVLIFSITDFSDMELEVSFIRRLNSEKIAQEFEEWKKEEAEEDDDDYEEDDYDFDDVLEDEESEKEEQSNSTDTMSKYGFVPEKGKKYGTP